MTGAVIEGRGVKVQYEEQHLSFELVDPTENSQGATYYGVRTDIYSVIPGKKAAPPRQHPRLPNCFCSPRACY